jgi:hypothetical protein
MWTKSILSVLFAAVATAQDTPAVERAIQFIFNPPTPVLTVTATQGDGTSCTIGKIAGATINAYLNCVNATFGAKATFLTAGGATATNMVWGYGDVLCVLVLNPTATAIAAAGSMPAVPAVSIGWQCSTNIRTNGAVTGQALPITGSVSWP